MNFFMKLFLNTHVGLYRLTKGKFGGHMGGVPILLLKTVGRKSGKKYTTPLIYIRDGGNYVIAASNGGADKHPGWYFNLHNQNETTIQVMADKITVTAIQASPEEKTRLWIELATIAPNMDAYQRKTRRDIPVMILKPVF